jgi:hypothetical protein
MITDIDYNNLLSDYKNLRSELWRLNSIIAELEEEKQRAWEPREAIEVQKVRQQAARECVEICEQVQELGYFQPVTSKIAHEIIEKFGLEI